MRKIIALLPILLLFTACSLEDSRETIMKAEGFLEDTPAMAESEQTESTEGSEIEFIEFDLDGDNILIDVSKVPILYEFLRIQQRPQQAIQEMELERMDIDSENIYILSFSCKNNHCSYLFFHEDPSKETYLVADMAKLVNRFHSPDHSKIALQFSRIGEEMMPRSTIKVFDINKWQPLAITSEGASNNILNYHWPFVSVEWIDDEQIAISIPDLIELNKNSYEKWSLSETNPVNTIIYRIKDN